MIIIMVFPDRFSGKRMVSREKKEDNFEEYLDYKVFAKLIFRQNLIL